MIQIRHRQSKEGSILWSHHEETRELPGERDDARNNARCTKARKTTHGLDGQHQDAWTGLPVDELLRMTEDGDKWRKYVHDVAKLGSRTAKEQNRHSVVQFNHRDNIHVVTCGLEKSELENVGPNRRGGKDGTGKRGNSMCMGIEM